MTYNLYIDILFLVNFLMDFLVLSVMRKVMKYHTATWKVVIGSVIGAIWAVFVAACPFIPSIIEFPVTYLIISGLMVKISYGLKGIKKIVKAVAGLYLTTLLMAGVMELLYQHTLAGYYIEQVLRGNNREAMPLYRFLLLAAATYFGTRYFLGWILENLKTRNHLYEVTMRYRGKEKTIQALLDTGNQLYEPVTRRPVHVVTYEALKEICESVSSVIYIPFGSVGKKSGMMPGIFLDEMEIRQGEEVKILKKPLVAICIRPLSAGGEYQMLLHEE